MKHYLLFPLFCLNILFAQTDYQQLTNWYFHPDKQINILANYNLDLAVIAKDRSVDSIINIDNKATVNTGVDVFWVHPTQLVNPPTQPATVPLDDQPVSTIVPTIIAQGGLLAKYGRFYAPRYRQASPASFLDGNFTQAQRAEALMDAYSDVKAAFLHYLNNHNGGNKIILAGHSQGAFMLSFLLRDVFDTHPGLRAQLLTAVLGGMAYVHAPVGSFVGGSWEHIPLCTSMDECGCIHSWRSFKESQNLPFPATILPIFNTVLQDSGLVFRNVDTNTDWFVQDSLFYGSSSTALRYFIVPDASYNLSPSTNFIAFEDMYTARFKRSAQNRAALAIDYNGDPTDQRPNDLLTVESDPGFVFQGFHVKDYHIYIWALLEQIDSKLAGCSPATSLEEETDKPSPIQIYPNPTSGLVFVKNDQPSSAGEQLFLYDMYGKRVAQFTLKHTLEFHVPQSSGMYYLVSKFGSQKLIVKD
jgi:hypothetical protein